MVGGLGDFERICWWICVILAAQFLYPLSLRPPIEELGLGYVFYIMYNTPWLVTSMYDILIVQHFDDVHRIGALVS